MTEAFDVIALGETMLSLVATDGPLDLATTFHATHGGAETNACVELARRGLRTAWVSRLGDDAPGHRIRAWLSAVGLDLTWVQTHPNRPTGLMLRDLVGTVQYWREGSAASTIDPADLDDVPIERARACFVTGITAMIGEGPAKAAEAFFDRAAGLRMLDVNLRAGLWGSAQARELLLPLVQRCDLLVGGVRELQIFAPGVGESLARACAGLGPSEVVVRAGRDGVGALDASGVWVEHRADARPDVDPVGAGDAFDAAYLATRLEDGDVDAALTAGAEAGALVATAVGDTGAAG